MIKMGDMKETFELMQLLCEGHAHDLQEMLRHQPNCQGSVNLIQDGIDLLIMQVESAGVLRRMDEEELLCTQVCRCTLSHPPEPSSLPPREPPPHTHTLRHTPH